MCLCGVGGSVNLLTLGDPSQFSKEHSYELMSSCHIHASVVVSDGASVVVSDVCVVLVLCFSFCCCI